MVAGAGLELVVAAGVVAVADAAAVVPVVPHLCLWLFVGL